MDLVNGGKLQVLGGETSVRASVPYNGMAYYTAIGADTAPTIYGMRKDRITTKPVRFENDEDSLPLYYTHPSDVQTILSASTKVMMGSTESSEFSQHLRWHNRQSDLVTPDQWTGSAFERRATAIYPSGNFLAALYQAQGAFCIVNPGSVPIAVEVSYWFSFVKTTDTGETMTLASQFGRFISNGMPNMPHLPRDGTHTNHRLAKFSGTSLTHSGSTHSATRPKVKPGLDFTQDHGEHAVDWKQLAIEGAEGLGSRLGELADIGLGQVSEHAEEIFGKLWDKFA
jgi:hypothetical protein